MVLYHYRARTPQGRALEGTVEAPSEREAARVLRSRGLLVSTLTDNRQMGDMTWRPARTEKQVKASVTALTAPAQRKKGLLGGSVGLRDLSLFCRQFATMINAGVSILTSLNILTRQAATRRLRVALADVSLSIEHGRSLTEAFRSRSDIFPPIVVNMVSAGETGGILEECFDRLAEHFEKEHAVSQKVKSAMSYPLVVSGVAVFVVIFMVTFVLPNFIGIFQQMGAELPTITRVVLNVSNFIRAYWYFLLAGLTLAILSLAYWASTPKGAFAIDTAILRMPLVGQIVLKRAVSRFARTLGTLLRSGVPLLVALAVVERTVGNRQVASAIVKAEDDIRAGHGLVAPLRASRIFPSMVLEMMGVGEETGAIDTMLSKVADFYDKDIDATVNRLSSMIEPIIIVVLGGVVGLILVSIITPMFDIYGTLNI